MLENAASPFPYICRFNFQCVSTRIGHFAEGGDEEKNEAVRSRRIEHSPLRPPPSSRLFPESRERNKVDTWPTRGGGEHALSASIHFSRSSARDTLTAVLRFAFFRYRDISPISSIFFPLFSPRIISNVFHSPLFVRNINLCIFVFDSRREFRKFLSKYILVLRIIILVDDCRTRIDSSFPHE